MRRRLCSSPPPSMGEVAPQATEGALAKVAPTVKIDHLSRFAAYHPAPHHRKRSPDFGQSTRGRRFYVQYKRQLATGLRVLCRTRTCAMKVSHWIFARFAHYKSSSLTFPL